MTFLAHGQLRHGAWSCLDADSAHSSRAVFAGPRAGQIAWQAAFSRSCAPLNPVLDAGGNLYACNDEQLFGWTPAGEPLPLAERPDRRLEFVDRVQPEQLLGPGGTLIVVTGRAVSCLSLQGSLRWQVRNLAAGQPVLSPDGNELYLMATAADRDGLELIALGTGTGIEHWRRRFLRDGVSPPAVAADGVLYLVAEDADRTQQTLRAIDGKTGEEHWRQKIAPTLQCWTPRLFGDELIYVCGTGTLQAFQPGGGLAWSLKVAADRGPAVAGDGRLLLLQAQPNDGRAQLCSFWPDGQPAGQVTLPPQLNAFGLPLAVDAAGHAFVFARRRAGGGQLLEFQPDLKPGFALDLPTCAGMGLWAIGQGRLVLCERGPEAAGGGAASPVWICVQ